MPVTQQLLHSLALSLSRSRVSVPRLGNNVDLCFWSMVPTIAAFVALPPVLSRRMCVCVLVLINIAPSSHSVRLPVRWSCCWSAQLAKQPRAVHIYKF